MPTKLKITVLSFVFGEVCLTYQKIVMLFVIAIAIVCYRVELSFDQQVLKSNKVNYRGSRVNNLTIQQFCQLETLKNDLQYDGYQYREKVEDNLTILELIDRDGNVVRELIVVL